MSPLITYSLTVFIITYGILLITEFIIIPARKALLIQAGFLVLVTLMLHLTVDFPTPRQAFGGTSPLVAVVLMLVCTALGMAAHYAFYLEENKGKVFSWFAFLRPFVVSPIILLPLLGSVSGSQQLTPIQLISFAFLAFQNGFFWKAVLEHARPKV